MTAAIMIDSALLDCAKGLECNNYECEQRHFDKMEKDILHRQRRLNDKNENVDIKSCSSREQKLIVTASRDMKRTASTWVYNAVRLLFRHSAASSSSSAAAAENDDDDNDVPWCDSYWIRCLSKTKLQLRLQHATVTSRRGQRAHVLVKTHEWTDYMTQQMFDREILPLLTHVVISVREGYTPDPAWLKVATHIIRYEDITDSTRVISVLRDLADHLGITGLSDDNLREVDYRLMTLPIPGDQSSKFWSFHSRRGGRSQPTIKPAPAFNNTIMNVFVTRHGARIDNGPDRDPRWLEKAGHRRFQDAHLSRLGRREADELASELFRRSHHHHGDEAVRLDHIVSSPFIRCIETANAISKVFNLSIKVEPGIAEVGTTDSQLASQKELETQFSFIDEDYSPVMSRDKLPKSEWGDRAAARRAANVAKTVQSRLGGSVLFVGHGASCLGLVGAFGAREDYIGYCSLTHFQWKAFYDDNGVGRGKWKLIGTFGDVSHLSDPQISLDSAW